MFLADLHIHSRYSRATSRDCVPEHLEAWARRKGLDVIGTGDFTHPAWRDELREKLEPAEDGLYTLKDPLRLPCETDGTVARPRFIVTGEISSIYKKNGRVRKVHNLLLLPGLEQAERLAKRLEEVGNLHSDGRPHPGPGQPGSARNHTGNLSRRRVYPRSYLDAAFFPVRGLFGLRRHPGVL